MFSRKSFGLPSSPPNKIAPEVEAKLYARFAADPSLTYRELGREFHVAPSTARAIVRRFPTR